MSSCRQVGRPLAQRLLRQDAAPLRPFTTSSPASAQVYKVVRERPEGEVDPVELDPNTAVHPWAEKDLWKAGTPPIGSRRRRYAIRTSQNIPFEQLPYQAFQEARKLLAEDREEKIAAIKAEVEKMRKIREADASLFKGGEKKREMKLQSLRQHIEWLKIQADINDPCIKRRFEDGLGDMNKPIYRYLAQRRWEAYERKIIEQRISQFHITPDILPTFSPQYDVQLFFRRAKVPAGKLLPSDITEVPPRLRIQPFDAGDRLVTIVILDPDVPNVAADGFTKRCHYLAANIPLSPTNPALALSRLPDADHVAVPYLPAFAQKGSPYHRLAIFVLDQPDGRPLDVAKLRSLYAANKTPEHNFSLKSLRDKFGLRPAGFTLFRAAWDETTADVMRRAGVPGADVELRPTRVRSLKPPKPLRGWEAKRQGPKYRHLWKYTKRIRGLSNAKGWIIKKRGDGGGRRG
ncbi:phosphatidylethanolamine-binding protein [Sodiomyces alkalinus F11]|uniref:Large ribosomal subunit protein mL38 n=1 Tax=Sodiomyces alkalinus (strain CBS 110278 / VKM F-3762 / F11) TaxID=1314773 RepID=A0A3N2PWJ4_SODAK|nr:phosphatidylethanolamine-binding protein [Sodiomyces alkalinus F11]ROT38881.1 phosphatidylethanolamine-binding protein [Sodiomyces alkalinus F11]